MANTQTLRASSGATPRALPELRRIELTDLRWALRRGWADLGASRADIVTVGLLYPALGLVLGRLAYGEDLLPLIFPLVSGFALVGPFAAVGLYEVSRRRELGEAVSWRDGFAVLRSPSLGAIMLLGLVLAGIFLLWLWTALALYEIFLGTDMPHTVGSLLSQVLGTRAGWGLIIVGDGVGFLFALAALCISVVSFPLLIDRDLAPSIAERASIAAHTSMRAVAANPVPMLAWGAIVAVLLALGSIPFFIGLAVVFPLLGHATWHLYRCAVV
jgi:uncharacterized membrane protein